LRPKSKNELVRAISVKQPWAYSILFLGKDVENKPMRTHHQSSLGLEPLGAQIAESAEETDPV
jgi:hypothetical protein